MKNKAGFTLIELLAVIVILAIISLIAVPITTNIIKESRENTNKVSVINYVRAVENSLMLREFDEPTIPNNTYSINSDGNICLDSSCSSILKVEKDGDFPASGQIKINNNKVIGLNNVKFSNFYANMDSSGNITINQSFVACEVKSGDKKTFGSTIKCGTEYFHIIKTNSTAGTISMLAEYNITLTTNPVQSSSAGTLTFSSQQYWADYYEHTTDEGVAYDSYYSLKSEYSNGIIYKNSNLNQYIVAYGNTLKNIGLSGASVTIPSADDVSRLGLPVTSGNYVDTWRVSPSYWTGSADTILSNLVTVVDNYYGITAKEHTNSSDYGIRPLVTLSTDQIS